MKRIILILTMTGALLLGFGQWSIVAAFDCDGWNYYACVRISNPPGMRAECCECFPDPQPNGPAWIYSASTREECLAICPEPSGCLGDCIQYFPCS